jgi:hypothetical protein
MSDLLALSFIFGQILIVRNLVGGEKSVRNEN